ncbi:AAEL001509-PA [Aedes aegypti]|uniref:AAEL001509-PA n=1 Tax=Aedes aegypti TaxID=7159 RepID=Q17KZ1_AEDAE|nr:AAEL001509-PA [Aedes aegypti]
MSKPSTIKASRISRDSGICVEDSIQSNSAPGDSTVKKRFPAGGGSGGPRVRTKSSYVHRLTQHFETLTCQDESSRISPASSLSSGSSRSVYQLELENVRAERQPEVSADQCDKSEEKMDDAVQVIETFYEEILVADKRVEKKFGVASQRIPLVATFDNDQSGNHLSASVKGSEAMGVSDKITGVGEFNYDSNRESADFELADTTPEPVVAEARNVFISQHEPATDHEHFNDDDDFSDTDSFDSSDDEELIALSSSRPDSNSSIKSKRISNIIKELLENEENYVQTLEKGIENYVGVMNQKDLPPALRGQKYHIFGNIESIYEFHKYKFLPKLRDNCASIQGVAETFIQLIEDNRFYCYILFALNRPKSEKICNKNLDFFQERQHQVGDKLGLNSFLLQPIQRLPRYKLLLAEINKEALKLIADALMDTVKDEIGVLCKAEKRLERFIDIVNEAMSINDICECYEDFKCIRTDLMTSFSVAANCFGKIVDTPPVLILWAKNNKNPEKNKPLNLFHQGKFRKMFEMDVYDWDRRRRYPSKVFFFEKCIIYTEKIKEYLEYRGHFVDSEVGLYNDGKTKLCVFALKRGIQEIEISNSDMSTVQKMASYIEDTMKRFAMQERQRINNISSKNQWTEQRVPSVMTINRGSTASGKSIISNNSSRDSFESGSQTIWYVDL